MEDSYCLELLHETALAILVFDGDREAWLPRSQIDVLETEQKDGRVYVTVKIPDWLAVEKELV